MTILRVSDIGISFGGLKAMDDTRLAACNAVAVARATSGTQLAKH